MLTARRVLVSILSVFLLCAFAQAQNSNCTVSGTVYSPNGQPASGATLYVLQVEQGGTPVQGFTPFNTTADGNGNVSFAVPANSIAWISLAGPNNFDGVPIPIPNAATANLNSLWQLPGGVTSFNTRQNDVTLTSTDVTSALGYTPASSAASVSSFNSRTGGVTLSSSDVTSALGYTPASSSLVVGSFNNRQGAVSLTSGDVNTALGFTPVNATSTNSFTAQQTITASTSSFYTPALQIVNTNKNVDAPELSLGLAGQYQPSIRFQTLTNAAPFNIEITGVNFNNVYDDVMLTGFNATGTGSKINPNAATLWFGLESNYYWNTPTQGMRHYMEWNMNFVNPNNTLAVRPLYFYMDRDAQSAAALEQGWQFTIGLFGNSRFMVTDPTGIPFFRVMPDASIWQHDPAHSDTFTTESTRSDGNEARTQFYMYSKAPRKAYIFNVGSVGIGVDPSSDAALDVNAGSNQGLRIRPRASAGSPTSGTWNTGTMIVDSNGVLYICTSSGTPGTWKKVSAE